MKRSNLMRYGLTGLTASMTLMSTVAPSVRAEIQTTGVPGSPGATTTIDGKQLPPPDPKFGGVVKEDALIPRPGGRRASFRPNRRPTSCSS